MGRAHGGTQTYLGLEDGAPQQRGLRTEYEHADRALKLFDEAQKLAQRAREAGAEELARETGSHAWRIVREADPVRLSYVSAVLGLTDQTIRDWLDADLLEDFGGAPRRVGLESVARVRGLVRDLRRSGQQRDLMTAVLRELEREELRHDDRFLGSVEQMRRGERAS
jgi:hypothetical protein